MKKNNPLLISMIFITLYFSFSFALLYFFGLSNDGVSTTIRTTSKISLIIFALIFLTSPLNQLRPSGFTRWLLKWRKEISIIFGITFLLSHLGLIYLLYDVNSPVTPERVRPIDIYAGGLGMVFLILMLITSFSKIRSSISPYIWKLIHTAGIYYVWGVFIFDQVESYFIKTPPGEGIHYIPTILILITVMAVRILSIVNGNITNHSLTG